MSPIQEEVDDVAVNDPVFGKRDLVTGNHQLGIVVAYSGKVAELALPVALGDFIGNLNIEDSIIQKIEALGIHASKEQMKEVIILLCTVRPMTREKLAALLQRKEDYIRIKFLKEMVKNGELHYLYPEMVKHPEQAYIANSQEERHE